MKRLFLVGLFVACAAPRQNSPGANTATGSNDDMICHEVADTGTLFTHTECTPREQADRDREDTRRALQRPIPANGGPNMPNGPTGH
jgi:hypothetical protein